MFWVRAEGKTKDSLALQPGPSSTDCYRVDSASVLSFFFCKICEFLFCKRRNFSSRWNGMEMLPLSQGSWANNEHEVTFANELHPGTAETKTGLKD